MGARRTPGRGDAGLSLPSAHSQEYLVQLLWTSCQPSFARAQDPGRHSSVAQTLQAHRPLGCTSRELCVPLGNVT